MRLAQNKKWFEDGRPLMCLKRRDDFLKKDERRAGAPARDPYSDGDWLLDALSNDNESICVNVGSSLFQMLTQRKVPSTSEGPCTSSQRKFYTESRWDTSSTNPDTDGDGVADGQEHYGYKVTIMWYEGETLHSKEIWIYDAHPNGKDLKRNGSPMDTDGDGISDADEKNPYQNFSWWIHPNPSKTMSEDEVKAQFSPLIKENMPPILRDVRVESKTEVVWCKGLFDIPYPCGIHAWTEDKNMTIYYIDRKGRKIPLRICRRDVEWDFLKIIEVLKNHTKVLEEGEKTWKEVTS